MIVAFNAQQMPSLNTMEGNNLVAVMFKNAQGELLPTPKARTFAAIKKSILAAVSSRNSKPMTQGKDKTARRAFQYAMALHKIDSPHSVNLPYSIERACDWRRAPDGTTRVAAIRADCGTIKIPHWDFTPEILPA